MCFPPSSWGKLFPHASVSLTCEIKMLLCFSYQHTWITSGDQTPSCCCSLAGEAQHKSPCLPGGGFRKNVWDRDMKLKMVAQRYSFWLLLVMTSSHQTFRCIGVGLPLSILGHTGWENSHAPPQLCWSHCLVRAPRFWDMRKIMYS